MAERLSPFNFPEAQRARYHFRCLTLWGSLLLIVGIVHTFSPFLDSHQITHTVLELVLLGGPAIGVLGVVLRVRTAPINEEFYPILIYWSLGVAGFLLIVGGLLLYYFGVPFWNHDALFAYNFWIALGAFGGVLIGYHEARAVSRAREATLSAKERDRLEHLNHLLRHDLLNKINLIQGSAELALEDIDEEVIDRLKTIRHQSEEATELIQNVRILVQASRDDQSLEPIDLTKIVEEEVTQMRDAYPTAKISTNLPNSVPVRADSLLGSIFENLLRNAIEHNDTDQPEVTVVADVNEETVIVTVSDNGPGIPSHLRDDLFAPSEQGDHGFGLYLVNTLIERYGGEVNIADTGSDGTTIRVELSRA